MNRQYVVLKQDGTVALKISDCAVDIIDYDDFCKLKNECDVIPDLWEIVHIHEMPEYVMLVDEEGLFKEENYPNKNASFLYGYNLNPNCVIVGDAVVVKAVGPDLYWLTDEDTERFFDYLSVLI